MRQLYSLLFYAVLPSVLLRLLWKSRRQPGYRQRWQERLGFYSTDPVRDTVWFHAVSVGECEAAFPLIKALLNQNLSLTLLVTCTTPTGSARIRQALGHKVRHVYLPYDVPSAVRRFLDHWQPRLGVIMETEIWPNLFAACRSRRIPLAIVNGRLSDKSVKGYTRLGHLVQDSLTAVHVIAAQTSLDADRYQAIGAVPERVKVLGNVKFDIDFDPAMRERSTRLRRELFQQRPVWIAGSTHPGEEEILLDALALVRDTLPAIVLIIAPRHPERAAQLRALCESRGLLVSNRSEGRPCPAATPVFLIDGMGELRTFYGAADVAFIGGSLVPHGGQNVLEAAVTGLPVLFGPYTANFREITRQLLSADGAIRVTDRDSLARSLLELFRNPALAQEKGQKGRAFVAANRGAVGRVTAMILQLLPQT